MLEIVIDEKMINKKERLRLQYNQKVDFQTLFASCKDFDGFDTFELVDFIPFMTMFHKVQELI